MWELDYKESWAQKNWCFWTVVLEKTLESPIGWKEIKPVNPKGNQSWIFIGRTSPEVETPVLWPPDAKNRLIRKDPDAGKVWRWEEKGTIDGWMALPALWTWVWVSSESWWWTGKLGMLQCLGSRRDRTERLNWAEHYGKMGKSVLVRIGCAMLWWWPALNCQWLDLKQVYSSLMSVSDVGWEAMTEASRLLPSSHVAILIHGLHGCHGRGRDSVHNCSGFLQSCLKIQYVISAPNPHCLAPVWLQGSLGSVVFPWV